MYNLKKVYGILSFEKNKINVLITEKNANKINCLFFHSIDINYLDENLNFINTDLLIKKVVELLKKTDEFVGINIKRYIINISYLPIRVVKNDSIIFSINNNELNEKNFNELIKKINFLDENSKETILKINPISWILDKNVYSSFPLEKKGENISFNYFAYITNKTLLENFKNLIINFKISALAYVNNQMSFSGLLPSVNNTNGNLVVDIKTNNSIINFYDKNNNFTHFESIDIGSDWIINMIKTKLTLIEECNILPAISAIEYLKYVNHDVSIINIHNEKFLNIKEATANDLKICIKIIMQKYFHIIETKIQEIQKKINSNYQKIYFNTNDCSRKILNSLFDENTENNNLCFFKNRVIGIEDKNIDNMLGSINLIDLWQINFSKKIYSIDPYVSQNIFNDQIKKEILLNVGVITTKWSAKLGG